MITGEEHLTSISDADEGCLIILHGTKKACLIGINDTNEACLTSVIDAIQ